MTKHLDPEQPVAIEKADIDRVDAVSGPANGVPFLIVKALDEQPDAREALEQLQKGVMHDPADPDAPRELGEATARANAAEAGELPDAATDDGGAEESPEGPAPDPVEGGVESESEPAAEATPSQGEPEANSAPEVAGPADAEAVPGAGAEPSAVDETPEPVPAADVEADPVDVDAAPDAGPDATPDGGAVNEPTPIAQEAADAVDAPELAKAADVDPKAAEAARLRAYIGAGVPGTGVPGVGGTVSSRVVKDAQTQAEAAAAAPVPDVPVTVTVEVNDVADAGSPAWEADDARNAQAAIDLLMALRERIDTAGQREGLEGDFDQAYSLSDACCALDFVLGVLAKYLVEEQAEAGEPVAKAASPAAQQTLARAFAPTQEKPVADDATETQPEPVEKAAEGTEPADVASAATEDPAPVEKAEEAVSEAPAAVTLEDLAKAIENIPTLDSVSKAVLESPALSDVLKSVVGEAVKDAVSQEVAPIKGELEKAVERIAEVEKQPMPGGPLLRGARGVNADGLTLVVKGADSDAGEQLPETPDDIAKALETVSDPAARDALARRLAAATHPAYRRP